MGNETELKFQISPKDLRRLKAARALHRSDGKPAKEENLVSVYFDTGKHKLRRKGVSLRVRHCGDKRLQTIKTEGDIPFNRGEWEHKIHSDAPDLRAARGTALAPFLTKKLKRQLKPIFETRVHRLTLPIRENSSRIELAFDEGQVRAGQKSATIGEVELELKRGKRADLFKLARVIGELVPAKLALKSKSEAMISPRIHPSGPFRARKSSSKAARPSLMHFTLSAVQYCDTWPRMRRQCGRRIPKACTRCASACAGSAQLYLCSRNCSTTSRRNESKSNSSG